MVNELRGGATAYGPGSHFGQSSSIASRNDPSTFADSGGFAITTPGSDTAWFTSNTPTWRTSPTFNLEDTITWQRRKHTFTTGGNVLISNANSQGQQMVRGISLGLDTNFDPAIGMFSTANFPGASTAQLTEAQRTYAVLTGRVTSVTSQAVLDDSGKYVELGPTSLPGGLRVYGSFVQDSWKLRPNLTLTGGIRYDVQTPYLPTSNNMSAVTLESACGMSGLGSGGLYSKCNRLNAQAAGGAVPRVIQLKSGTAGCKTHSNNITPPGSHARRPHRHAGLI